MTETKEQISEVFYGIKLSNVTDEMLQGVVDIYFNIAEIKPTDSKVVTKENLTSQLQHSNAAEYRFGSKYSMNSKLWVRTEDYLRNIERQIVDKVVRFKFDPNMDMRNDAQRMELQAKEQHFRRATSDFLEKTGLAVVLEPN